MARTSNFVVRTYLPVEIGEGNVNIILLHYVYITQVSLKEKSSDSHLYNSSENQNTVTAPPFRFQ